MIFTKKAGKSIMSFFKRLGRADILIYLAVLAAALATYLIFNVFSGADAPSELILTTPNGVVHRALPAERETLTLTGEGGITVTLLCEADGVCVIDADCPDKCCVNTPKLTSIGRSIVCLPAKITITLKGEAPYDAKVG